MVWNYSLLASLEVVPWWNVGHVGAGSCIILHWFCAIPHWLTHAPLSLPERPQFLPSGDFAEALAQLGLSLQKIMYKVAVLIWRLLITATNFCIIRHFNNRHNYPSKCVVLNCHNYPSKCVVLKCHNYPF